MVRLDQMSQSLAIQSCIPHNQISILTGIMGNPFPVNFFMTTPSVAFFDEAYISLTEIEDDSVAYWRNGVRRDEEAKHGREKDLAADAAVLDSVDMLR